jgi:pimeloyl-ACP methyl ester carboxylesterase
VGSAARLLGRSLPNEERLRANFISLAATRLRHLGHSPHPERYNPDAWTDEFAFLTRPGNLEIQSDLFFDYQTNVQAYPAWQAYLREHRPPLQVLWGRYDPSFEIAGAEAYRRDQPEAEIHVLEAGHFPLDEATDQIAALMRRFLAAQGIANV